MADGWLYSARRAKWGILRPRKTSKQLRAICYTRYARVKVAVVLAEIRRMVERDKRRGGMQ